jgi:hypothetical protein
VLTSVRPPFSPRCTAVACRLSNSNSQTTALPWKSAAGIAIFTTSSFDIVAVTGTRSRPRAASRSINDLTSSSRDPAVSRTPSITISGV